MLATIIRKQYIINNVRRCCKSIEYIQIITRATRSTNILVYN